MVVVDCGLGNIHSLHGCLTRLAPEAVIEFTADPEWIQVAACVLLPGDGAFGACIKEIDRRGLRESLVTAASCKPFFGICVGMQVLYEGSKEGPGVGLGILPGIVQRFPSARGAKIPLMGWLDVQITAVNHPLLKDVTDGDRFYFLNSFYAPAVGEQVALQALHTTAFAAAVTVGKLFATQFHPEKSSDVGVQLLANFLAQSGIKVQAS